MYVYRTGSAIIDGSLASRAMNPGAAILRDLGPTGVSAKNAAAYLPNSLADTPRRMTTMASQDGNWNSSRRDDDDDDNGWDSDDDESLIQDDDGPETTPSLNDGNASQHTTLDFIHSSRSSSPDQEPPKTVTMTPRAYQLEMLEESLKQNIIVAMDTGSGKTQVAIMRIQIELERSDKIAWFLAPTVSLAEQQFEAIQTQLPGVQSRLILGSDNVEAWSTKPGVWDAVLFNHRIIVSTYQILFDAVAHAFVPLASLGIIVIDEAHNAKGDNPVARLMREHYAPHKAQGLSVPHILGLTASPLMRSKLEDIDVLEKTLDAVCKMPSRHRAELMAQVKPPEIKTILYRGAADPSNVQPTSAMLRLQNTSLELDLRQDPCIRRLLADHTEKGRKKLMGVLLSKKTFCRSQIESFYWKAEEMWKTFGPWAADYYIYRVISHFLKGSNNLQNLGSDGLGQQEWVYMAEAFRKVDAKPPPETPTELSPKVCALLDALEFHEGDPVGIIFVKERASVAVLSHILTVHPKTSRRYRVGSMVGTSHVSGKRQDFLDLTQKDYLSSLQAFRKGAVNLLVATSVLEEGIDVPACNLVVCFDKPGNLKSFIQRRGRARMSASHLYLLVDNEADMSARVWQSLEREMKRKFEDDMRENRLLEELENSDASDYPILRDEETNAQVTIRDAKQHLQHFCATLLARKYVDCNPVYVIHDLEGCPIDASKPGLRKATVHLPASLPPELRTFQSLYAWLSEAKACQDAAFQAYAKLYEVRLVNRNMLPVRASDVLQDIEPCVGIAAVGEQLNPWPGVARAWRDGAPISNRGLTISRHDGSLSVELELALPVPVPYMNQFDLYWDPQSAWFVRTNREAGTDSTAGVTGHADHTNALLAMAFGHRWQIQQQKRYPVRFTCRDRDIRLDDMGATEINPEMMAKGASTHLVRDMAGQNHPYFYLDWLQSKPAADLVSKPYNGFDEAPQDAAYVAVKSWPKKVGAFRRPQPISAPAPCTKPYPRVLPADQIRADSIPAAYAHAAMFIPAITRALEVHLVAKDLLDTKLGPTGISDLSLVVTAISASAARGPTDYERIEFLGDAVLKFCATLNCAAHYPDWPEGILSPLKDLLVSNSRLFDAAKSFGLASYIIHDAFTLHKWRPTYVEDLLENPPPATGTRLLPTKTLADVVEALIGAAYISGGTPKALACISLFLTEFQWSSIEHCREVLYKQAPDDEQLPVTMRRLEELVGYAFTKKSLLVEAMTHSSCRGPHIHASLDRLEFLGDSILDYVVVRALFSISHPAPLENSALHLLRAALVNADILAFLAMEWAIPQDGFDVITTSSSSSSSSSPGTTAGTSSSSSTQDDSDATQDDSDAKQDVIVTPRQTMVPLPSFLRYGSSDLGLAMRATGLRYEALREQIREALWKGPRYPWSLLARLQAQKFFSDVVESLLGAVWLDSGDIAQCEAVAERIGILPLMRRLVADRVWLMHPKEELGVLAGSKPVDYLVEETPEDEWGEKQEGETLFRCEVTVDKEVVGRAGGARNRLEAMTKAAEEACVKLRGRKED
ncbi:hypothetical protein VTH82DRAFT_8307 [Thermothelomyces myriococcoides]